MINDHCYGCGIKLQYDQPSLPGFAIKPKEEKPVLCKRCFRLKHYNEVMDVVVTKNQFINHFSSVMKEDSLILYLVDGSDMMGSSIHQLERLIGKKDVVMLATKIDLLPKTLKKHKAIQIMQQLTKGMNIVHYDWINYKEEGAMEGLIELIEAHRRGRHVYVMGMSNVGKSTMINALIKFFNPKEEFLIVTSLIPGTTLDFIKIPLDESHYLFDSPGLINEDQMIHAVAPKQYDRVLFNRLVKPKVFQLDPGQTLFIENLVQVDFIQGEHSSFTVYINPLLTIHRTKYENALNFKEKHGQSFEVQPTYVETMTYSFKNIHNQDIWVHGLGWISINGHVSSLKVTVPKHVLVTNFNQFI